MRALIAAIALIPGIASAQDSDPIIVTGRGLTVALGTDAYDSTIITRERLALSASGRIEDVLRDVAGFQQFRRTDSRAANPTSQGATLRALGGNASSRALVLLDGVPQADPFTGYIPYSALRPERLASARVTRGGGAGAFGAGAVGGTIELASGGPGALPAALARVVAGSRNALEFGGGRATPLGAGFATIHGSYERGDGYLLIGETQRGPADIAARHEAWSVAMRGIAPIGASLELQANGLVFDDHRLRGLAGTGSRSRGADASVKLVGRGRWAFEALGYIQERGFRSGFVAVSPDRASTTTTLDQYSTPSIGLGAKVELRPPVGPRAALRIGADMRTAQGTTNEFFRYMSGVPTRVRRAGGTNTTLGGFVEGSALIGALTLTGGARLDQWSIRDGLLVERVNGGGITTLDLRFADRTGVRPTFRGGAVAQLSDRLSARAAAYTGFRVPTLNELYRPFRVGADATAANGALAVERLKGLEAGVGYQQGQAKVSLTAFYNQLDGAIANVTLGAGPAVFPQVGFVASGGVFRERRNLDAITVAGIEANATIALGQLRLNASYAYADARVRASGVAAPLDGNRPAQTPAHQGSATIAYAPAKGMQASLTLRYAGAQLEDDLGTRRLPGALTVDGVISVPISAGVRLVARGENMFDAEVVSGLSATGVKDLATPQTFWLGLTYAM